MTLEKHHKIVKALSYTILVLVGTFLLLILNKPTPSNVHNVPAFAVEGLSHMDLSPAADQNLFAINVFASWCGYCRLEHDHIMALSNHMAVYGIAYKDKPQSVKAYLDQSGNPYQKIGYDYSGVIMAALDTRGTPETLIVDGDMNIIFRRSGVLTSSILENSILPLIK